MVLGDVKQLRSTRKVATSHFVVLEGHGDVRCVIAVTQPGGPRKYGSSKGLGWWRHVTLLQVERGAWNDIVVESDGKGRLADDQKEGKSVLKRQWRLG